MRAKYQQENWFQRYKPYSLDRLILVLTVVLLTVKAAIMMSAS